jgi:hypothetical protein
MPVLIISKAHYFSFQLLILLGSTHSSRYHLLPQLGTLHLTSRVCLRLANRPSTEKNNLICENNLILFPQHLKKTPAHSTIKNIPTLVYVLSSPTEAVSGLGKKPMTTQPNNNNALVIAKAMNGDGDSESRGGDSGTQWRWPQRCWPKEQRQGWWWRRQLGGSVGVAATAAEVVVVASMVAMAGEVAGEVAAAEAVMAVAVAAAETAVAGAPAAVLEVAEAAVDVVVAALAGAVDVVAAEAVATAPEAVL